MQDLVEFFPSSHQLLPSRWYFDLGGQPFVERRDSLNTSTYSYDQLTAWLDQRHPRSAPGTTNMQFHNPPALSQFVQDDWRNDATGVDYFHIY